MAWTTPRTWVAGEVVTAALMNTHVRDNENVLKTSINDDGTLKNLLDRNTTESADYTNSTTETTMYSFSVPGGTLGTGNILRMTVTCYMDMNTTSVTLTLRITWGGAAAIASSLATTATTKGVYLIEVILNANNSASSQRMVMGIHGVTNNQTLASTNFAAGSSYVGYNDALTVSSGSAQTLGLTAQWGSASANAHFKRFAGMIELLRAA